MTAKTKISETKPLHKKEAEPEFESCGPECQDRLDETGDGTFPASDPPSSGKSTGPGDNGSAKGK
ncbi:hypothetical protein [Acetobacter fallax]|uniref:Transposase n=1 Tax=Acetobacter fallax TaxID=1737473 RepID=A0ABX0K5M1_9PROT|nr:hypothetical protein [Acetobacter fallax]NHO31687.1 hypothetical protein [Acetobacter fallax]NHO35246.1 hypothetical protein [Acetobacter fallax]